MTQSWIDPCAAPDAKLFDCFCPERRPIGNYLIGTNRALNWTLDHGAPTGR